jgi:hypothetical protein
MATNIPTNCSSAADITARDAEYTGTPCTDVVGDGTAADPYLGMNRAGSNAPGIGIATGFIDPKLTDWSILDQHEAARTPQDGQLLGGAGFVDRSSVAWPSSGGVEGVGALPITHTVGADINDTANYLAATQQAVADAVVDLTTGAVNKTGVTVEIGDVAWYPVPVA